MRGVQKRRPSLFDLVDRMQAMTIPTLVMTRDEDWPCLEPAPLMKRTIMSAALVVMPNTGHTVNLEEPASVLPDGRRRPLAATRPARDGAQQLGEVTSV
jgi:pimeloyl-ACP methyl ester carboxylesterase